MPDIRKLRKLRVVPIITAYVIISVITRLVEKQSFEQYVEYQDNILTGTGIIFGVLGVVTLYYIGKYHDYSKEIIKAKAEHLENFEKMIALTKKGLGDQRSPLWELSCG